MTARRPLLTAVAAGSVLCAVWLVPTAHATSERPGHPAGNRAPAVTQNARNAQGTQELKLASTGGVDTTPYLVGGIAFVTAGGALVTGAVRRSRAAAR